MEVKEILGQAFKIGSEAIFKVRFYDVHEIGTKYIEKELTYIELGTFLITNQSNIEIIYIFKKGINEKESPNYDLDGNDKDAYLSKEF